MHTRTKHSPLRSLLLVLPAVVAVPACSGGDDEAKDVTYTIPFAARFGADAFACGQTYATVGSGSTGYIANDFRFFVHDVRLVEEGSDDEVPLELVEDETWQHEGLALLDFENGTAGCQSGSLETNTSIVGIAPKGDYHELRFTLGVPAELNHLDPTTAPAPLDASGMLWVWQSGYKFLRIDGASAVTTSSYHVHIGSTGCDGSNPEAPPDSPCTTPNELDVAVHWHGDETVVADAAALLEDATLTANTPMTAPGCMSTPTDPDCAPVFGALGLPFGGTPAAAQQLFSAE